MKRSQYTDTMSKHWTKGLFSRVQWGKAFIGALIALSFAFGLGGLIAWAMYQIGSEDGLQGNLGPMLLGTHMAGFLGYALAGMYVRRRTYHDPILHALAIVGITFVIMLVACLIDMLLGFPLENAISGGGDHERFAAVEFIAGPFWLVPAVGIPASLLGSIILPPRGENLDERDYDPDTQK